MNYQVSDYDSTYSYGKGNYCRFNGQLYKARENNLVNVMPGETIRVPVSVTTKRSFFVVTVTKEYEIREAWKPCDESDLHLIGN